MSSLFMVRALNYFLRLASRNRISKVFNCDDLLCCIYLTVMFLFAFIFLFVAPCEEIQDSLEFWISGTGFWIPCCGFWISGTEFWIPCCGFRMSGTGFWIVDSMLWIPDFRNWILDSKLWILDSMLWILDFRNWIPDYRSWISDSISVKLGFVPHSTRGISDPWAQCSTDSKAQRIPESTSKNFPDSEIWITLIYARRIQFIFYVLKDCAYLELNCRCQYCNYWLDNIILKGGPIHKPYWLPWAPLPHLFSKFNMYILCFSTKW